MRIYEPKLEKRIILSNSMSFNSEFEYDSDSFEDNIDAGCFSPDNWDIMMRKYIKRRSAP
ncbi:MAG: hypothetical protein ACFE96_11665 [Candidatus Hermodarchaeota archaeon]